MSNQLSVVSDLPVGAFGPGAQLCPGCGEVFVMAGSFCGECQRMENVLAREYEAWEQRSRRHREAELRRAERQRQRARWVFRMRCRRKLEGWACGAGCIAILYWFLWETRGWWLQWPETLQAFWRGY